MKMVFEMVFILGFWVGNNWFGLHSSPPISDCILYFSFGISKQSLAVRDLMQAKSEYAKLGRVSAIFLSFSF
jgi:hypothetical protein